MFSLPPQVSINNKGLVYSVILLLASVFLTVRKRDEMSDVKSAQDVIDSIVKILKVSEAIYLSDKRH